MAIAEQLLAAFARTVRMNGGALSILSASDDAIRLGYMPGADADCGTGACVLPHLELQEMMREWLSRRDPACSVTVRLIGPDGG